MKKIVFGFIDKINFNVSYKEFLFSEQDRVPARELYNSYVAYIRDGDKPIVEVYKNVLREPRLEPVEESVLRSEFEAYADNKRQAGLLIQARLKAGLIGNFVRMAKNLVDLGYSPEYLQTLISETSDAVRQ